jgi:ketosteroid isomerase-like protein
MKLRMLFGFLGAFGAFAVLLPGFSSRRLGARAEEDPRRVAAAVLAAQQAAWNRGDIVSFVKGYRDSPELTFSGSNGITHGYAPVLAHYKQDYPDQKAMGHLEFSLLEMRPLGQDAVLVLGRWHLERESGEVGGNFTLVFEHLPEGWKIIHDHTSTDLKKP